MNYYEILRIPETASLMEIKNAYKRLVKKYHPDIYEGNKLFAEAKIKEINEAYEVLSENTRKAKYDAELNYKKFEPSKEEFVKTSTVDDFEKYKKAYDSFLKKNKKVKKEPKKIVIKTKYDINSIGKNYFFKFDKLFHTEEKQDIVIMILLFLIACTFLGILKYIL